MVCQYHINLSWFWFQICLPTFGYLQVLSTSDIFGSDTHDYRILWALFSHYGKRRFILFIFFGGASIFFGLHQVVCSKIIVVSCNNFFLFLLFVFKSYDFVWLNKVKNTEMQGFYQTFYCMVRYLSTIHHCTAETNAIIWLEISNTITENHFIVRMR